ncbi:hypothetical protein V1514DRAFT_14408 [Lipomyces japonicus]|uniref:uncharacterized protein n=1 Tax=Lipomyces japonicus TaxID=56871 RepID=UPI0034CDA9A0
MGSPKIIEDDFPEKETEDFGFRALSKEPIQIKSPVVDPSSQSKLLAIAITKGLYAIAVAEGFITGTTKSLRQKFTDADKTLEGTLHRIPQKIKFILFTADELYLLVVAETGIIAWYAVDDLKSESLTPKGVFKRGVLKDIKVNPGNGKSVAVLAVNDIVYLIDLPTKSIAPLSVKGATSFDWALDGHSVIVGDKQGVLTEYDTKDELFVVYSNEPEPENHEFDTVIIEKGSNSIKYSKAYDICLPFGVTSKEAWWHTALIKGWNPKKIPTLITLANSASIDIALISSESNIFFLDDMVRASLPSFNSNETSPVGLQFDFSATEKVLNPAPGVESSDALPILFVLNNEGQLKSWHVIWKSGILEGFANLKQLKDRAMASVEAASYASSIELPVQSTPSSKPGSAVKRPSKSDDNKPPNVKAPGNVGKQEISQAVRSDVSSSDEAKLSGKLKNTDIELPISDLIIGDNANDKKEVEDEAKVKPKNKTESASASKDEVLEQAENKPKPESEDKAKNEAKNFVEDDAKDEASKFSSVKFGEAGGLKFGSPISGANPSTVFASSGIAKPFKSSSTGESGFAKFSGNQAPFELNPAAKFGSPFSAFASSTTSTSGSSIAAFANNSSAGESPFKDFKSSSTESPFAAFASKGAENISSPFAAAAAAVKFSSSTSAFSLNRETSGKSSFAQALEDIGSPSFNSPSLVTSTPGYLDISSGNTSGLDANKLPHDLGGHVFRQPSVDLSDDEKEEEQEEGNDEYYETEEEYEKSEEDLGGKEDNEDEDYEDYDEDEEDEDEEEVEEAEEDENEEEEKSENLAFNLGENDYEVVESDDADNTDFEVVEEFENGLDHRLQTEDDEKEVEIDEKKDDEEKHEESSEEIEEPEKEIGKDIVEVKKDHESADEVVDELELAIAGTSIVEKSADEKTSASGIDAAEPAFTSAVPVSDLGSNLFVSEEASSNAGVNVFGNFGETASQSKKDISPEPAVSEKSTEILQASEKKTQFQAESEKPLTPASVESSIELEKPLTPAFSSDQEKSENSVKSSLELEKPLTPAFSFDPEKLKNSAESSLELEKSVAPASSFDQLETKQSTKSLDDNALLKTEDEQDSEKSDKGEEGESSRQLEEEEQFEEPPELPNYLPLDLETFESDEQGLTKVFDEIYRGIEGELSILRENAFALSEYVDLHSVPFDFGPVLGEDDVESIRMSQARFISEEVNEFRSELKIAQAYYDSDLERLHEVNTSLLRLESKLGRAGNLIQKRSDKGYLLRLKSRSLPVDAAELQKKIRQGIKEVTDQIDNLEKINTMTKSKLNSFGSGSPLNRPSIDGVQKSIQRITRFAHRRAVDVAELEKEFAKVSLSNLAQSPIPSPRKNDILRTSVIFSPDRKSTVRDSQLANSSSPYRDSSNGSPRKVQLSQDAIDEFLRRKKLRSKITSAILERPVEALFTKEK